MALIVVMEHDAGTRMMVASVLKRDGHVVLGAEDAAKGLELVRQSNPELIISDVQMPGMNGFQMLASLRQDPANATIPVILLTSLQERAHIRIGMTTGADDYITKPFRPDELRAAVAAQLNKRSIQASLRSMAVDAAVELALVEQKHQLAKLYEQRLAAELSGAGPPETAGPAAGSAGNVGAVAIQQSAAGLKALAADRVPPDAAALLAQLRVIWEQTEAAIATWG